MHSHSGPANYNTSDTPVQLPKAVCRPPPLLTWTTPRLGQPSHRTSLDCHVFTKAHIAIPWTKGGVDKARTSPCGGGVPCIKQRRITRPVGGVSNARARPRFVLAMFAPWGMPGAQATGRCRGRCSMWLLGKHAARISDEMENKRGLYF